MPADLPPYATVLVALRDWAQRRLGEEERSTNGGSTWRRQPSGTSNVLIRVACLSPSTCVAVGQSGTILRTTNGGNTWRSV